MLILLSFLFILILIFALIHKSGSTEQKTVQKIFDFDYAIIPGQITGLGSNVMHLSFLTCPGLSGGAVVCTNRGVVLGYIAGDYVLFAHHARAYQSERISLVLSGAVSLALMY